MLVSLLASIASGEVSQVVARARKALVAYLVAGVLCLVGIGFLVGAGYIYLADQVGDLEAALWFAGGFVLLGLIVVIGHRLASRARKRRVARRRSSDMRGLAGAAALAALPIILSSRKGLLGLAAPIAAAAAYAIYRENNPGDPRRR